MQQQSDATQQIGWGPVDGTATDPYNGLSTLHAPHGDGYDGKLEVFVRPANVGWVKMTSDEVTAVCPVTGQRDFYTVEIEYNSGMHCIESKSLKMYLGSFANTGIMCEALASTILDAVVEALMETTYVEVKVTQKSRGGITIEANAMFDPAGEDDDDDQSEPE